MTEKRDYQRFKPSEIAKSFPETAKTLLLDMYLTNETAASARVFRVYRETSPRYHAGCDEYLYVLMGRGTFWMGEASNGAEFTSGDLLLQSTWTNRRLRVHMDSNPCSGDLNKSTSALACSRQTTKIRKQIGRPLPA